MAQIPMNVSPGQIPGGKCPDSLQEQFNLFASLLTVTFPLSAGIFNYGNTVPVPDQQGFPWVRLNSDGSPDGLFVYFNGSWVRPHPVPANSPTLVPYNGSLASITTYDGGESGTVGPASGPMWSVSTTDGAVPLADGSNVVAYGRFLLGQSADFPQGATGGATEVTLTLPNIPAHVHPPLAPTTTFSGFNAAGGVFGPSGGNDQQVATTGSAGGQTDGSTLPTQILNPYLSIYLISRTGRIYYRA